MLLSRRTVRLFWLAAISVAAVFFSDFLRHGLQSLLGSGLRHTAIRHSSNDLPLCKPIDGYSRETRDGNQTKKRGPLEKHLYKTDGLLEVNENGPHPIYELMSRAEAAWQEKLARASRTLPDAVREYKRRYHRAPPKGFDLWWEYVVKHNVRLPDEYDSIHEDLEPFWGIEPRDLLAAQKALEKKVDTYTVGKNETGQVGVLTWAFEEGKYKQLIWGSTAIIDLLKEVEDQLPPFRAVFSPHDSPSRLMDYGIKANTLEAATTRSYIAKRDLPEVNHFGWVSACPPSSPARREKLNLDILPPTPQKKTFIYDHRSSMDPCKHPQLFHYHGQFLSHDYGPSPQKELFPEFAYCSTMLHHDIRIPTPYGWVEEVEPRSADPPWDEKLDERLLWRGSNTGIFHADHVRWKNAQRDHLVRFANELNGTSKVLLPTKRARDPLDEPRELRNSRLKRAMYDIAFAGEPLNCDNEACDKLKKMYPWREYQRQEDAGSYKYVIDVDGNGWSGRFKRLITSNSVIFKSTIYPEWYHDRVQPWLHYVPIQVGLSDLHDALIFFRGDGNGDGAHEQLAKKIAVAGRQWSKNFWRKEDLVAYFFRLILEYARLMSEDRESMSYTEMNQTR